MNEIRSATSTPQLTLSLEEHRRLRKRYRRRTTLTAYAFLSPNLVVFVAFLLIPVVWLFVSTFRTKGVLGPAEFVGLDNWRDTFTSPLVQTSIRNTVVYSAMAIPAVFVIAMVLALALNAIPRGGAPTRVALYVPTLQPAVVAAFIFTFVLHPDFGVFNFALRGLGRDPINFLGDTSLALPTIAGIEVWRGTGFWTMMFLASLTALPNELYHAAELDGAGAIRRFVRMTLPLLRPTFYFAVIFATIVNLQLFDSVFALTDGGPVNSTITVSLYIYRSLFAFGDIGFGAALSFLLVITVLLLTGLQTFLLRERK
ncbi:MAG: sugar ABC transporter permease [Acidimicrobiia bacterium]|nr:sugar ABC transporter permease [Acidimicrobiia bacterium]MCY4458324.1 sugar ABC transporter permease [Acidimicrobiaceae bacterium]